MVPQTKQNLTIIQASSRQHWADYHQLCRRIYADDPQWIEPLRQTVKGRWAERHPWFHNAKAAFWLAYRDQQPVGCISAQVDERAPVLESKVRGYFGQFECIDDQGVAQGLIQVADEWLSGEGCQRMDGPFDLHINDQCGLLVEGFDTPPMMMMPHHPEYYARLLTSLGFEKIMALYAYRVAPNFEAPRAMKRLKRQHESSLKLRQFDMRRFNDEMALLRVLFNDAWHDNWGFVPFSEAEFSAMGSELKTLLIPEYTCIAFLDNRPVGFLVALPNLNELIKSFEGRLFPLNWARLLWNIRRRKTQTARVPLMGVSSHLHHTPTGALVAFSMMDQVRWALHKDGIQEVEMSWILETNQGMNSLIEVLGGERYKTYHIVGKAVGTP